MPVVGVKPFELKLPPIQAPEHAPKSRFNPVVIGPGDTVTVTGESSTGTVTPGATTILPVEGSYDPSTQTYS